MKKSLVIISALTLCIFQTIGFAGAKKTTPPNDREHPKQSQSWMKDQNDQTDTYAIPLDSSEEEERQEMQELDSYHRGQGYSNQPKPAQPHQHSH